ncbi:hypothetical protein ACFQMA_08065 [Halosimplex aquaticum]|uniref:Uncharacterized protein n=1 Tax=Halosimplex aquaticum TaxID=3026162 RepID=A0ABD5XXD3_9EURY|nr:hypothetical protein [Halosimplex aquaticum]
MTEWRYISSNMVSDPLVRQIPYLELKLEHPGLEPAGHGERFFPDVVPYELDRTPRVFYWRPVLPPSVGNPSEWNLICATTHELSGFDALPTEGPPLVTDEGDGTTLVVGGTIGGETTKSHVESYTAPALSIDTCSDSEVRLTVDGTEYCVSNGQRRRIRLGERNVDPSDGDGGSTTVVPELVVRYPGPRELHHPPPGSTYRLFPSFNLEIDEIPNPLSIPTTADELDDATLATKLGVDLSQRPYPERVLWQAFAYTAFDPHTDTIPELTQLETGHIVVRAP